MKFLKKIKEKIRKKLRDVEWDIVGYMLIFISLIILTGTAAIILVLFGRGIL